MLTTADFTQQSFAGLIEITERQLARWSAALNRVAVFPIPPSVSLNYWYVLSGLYKAEGAGADMEREAAYGLIPNAKINTGRKYVSACAAQGFVLGIHLQRRRYLRLTATGRALVEGNCREWLKAFSALSESIARRRTSARRTARRARSAAAVLKAPSRDS